MAFTHYRTGGFFLKKDDKGEADQLFTIFTEDFGKLKILARAIRKIKSKLRSSSRLFYLSEIEFIQGRTYKTLTDAILIEKFKNLKKNSQKLGFVYKIADVLDNLLTDEEKDEKIWQLLLGTFKRLNDLKLEIGNQKLEILYYYFLWNLFSSLGYAPELYFCPICSRKLLPETFFFVPEEGGVICWHCLAKLKNEPVASLPAVCEQWAITVEQLKEKGVSENGNPLRRLADGGKKYLINKKPFAVEINVDTVKVLRIFLKKNFDILKKLKIEEKDKEDLKKISEFYLDFLKSELSKTKR